MGGCGSGWYGRRSSRPFAGEMFELPIGRIVQSGVLAEGIARGTGSLDWFETALCALSGVRFDVERRSPTDAQLLLSYDVRAGERVSLSVALRGAPQPFGGMRWRYTCPDCGRACRSLFRPIRGFMARFACRRCQGVRYQSQSLGRADRLQYRAAKIRQRVCAPGADGVRRKGLHRDTWRKALATAEELDLWAFEHRLPGLEAFLSRCQPLPTHSAR